MTTPTPLDISWLKQQLTAALASASDSTAASTVVLSRGAVEMALYVVERPAQQQHRYDIDNDVLKCAMLAELRRLAKGTEAPSKGRWDAQRDRALPSAQHCCYRLNRRWVDLVKEAGLELGPHAQRYYDDEPEPDSGRRTNIMYDDPFDGADTLAYTAESVATVVVDNQRITRQTFSLR